NFNKKAIDAAGKLNKPLGGTSDIHFLTQVGKTTSIVRVREKSFLAVSAAIKAGNLELQTNPLTIRQLGVQVLQLRCTNVRRSLRAKGFLARTTVAAS